MRRIYIAILLLLSLSFLTGVVIKRGPGGSSGSTPEGFTMRQMGSENKLYIRVPYTMGAPDGENCAESPWCMFNIFGITFGETDGGTDDRLVIQGGNDWDLNITSCAHKQGFATSTKRQRCWAAAWLPATTGQRQDFLCTFSMTLRRSVQGPVAAENWEMVIYEGEYDILKQDEGVVTVTTVDGAVDAACGAADDACDTVSVGGHADIFRLANPGDVLYLDSGFGSDRGTVEIKAVVNATTVAISDTTNFGIDNAISAQTGKLLHLLHYMPALGHPDTPERGCVSLPCSYASGVGNVSPGPNNYTSFSEKMNWREAFVCQDKFDDPACPLIGIAQTSGSPDEFCDANCATSCTDVNDSPACPATGVTQTSGSSDGFCDSNCATSCADSFDAPVCPQVGLPQTTGSPDSFCDSSCSTIHNDQVYKQTQTILFQAGRKYEDPTNGALIDNHYLSMMGMLGYLGYGTLQPGNTLQKIEDSEMTCTPIHDPPSTTFEGD